MKYEIYFKSYLKAIESKLDEILPKESQPPSVLHEAMRYAVFTGGKRFRPVLTLAACEATGGKPEDALLPACAIELIHCYSLVHDDLPALDNDDLRRGQPTCHKRYGEANGILTGDALLTYAFEVLGRVRPAEKAVDLVAEISTAAGTCGMIGGQVVDLLVDRKTLDLPMLDYITIHKTGKLIKSSSVSGAIAAAASKDMRRRMLKYGELLGMAFQSIDDLDDGDGYLRLMKPKEVRSKVRDLIAHAKREIKPLGKKAEKLQALADFLLERMPQKNYASVDR
jgi:geranylgeranyl diphosphate synthase type II